MDTEPTTEPVIAQKGPFEAEIKGGETYYWCRCGRSGNQPFCDGSHKVTALTPIPYTPEKDETVYFCGCKNSGFKPFCDGTHESL